MKTLIMVISSLALAEHGAPPSRAQSARTAPLQCANIVGTYDLDISATAIFETLSHDVSPSIRRLSVPTRLRVEITSRKDFCRISVSTIHNQQGEPLSFGLLQLNIPRTGGARATATNPSRYNIRESGRTETFTGAENLQLYLDHGTLRLAIFDRVMVDNTTDRLVAMMLEYRGMRNPEPVTQSGERR